MNTPEFEPAAEDRAVAEALMTQRPVPGPTFRVTLAGALKDSDPGYGHRPARLWANVGVLAALGALLILLGLIVSVGVV